MLSCAYTGRERRVGADSLVLITARRPNDGLYRQVAERLSDGSAGPVRSLRRIGDCEAPGIIATAIYSGHRYARELELPQDQAGASARRDRFLEAI